MNTTKELFKKFVFGYISAGHTQTDESIKELKQLIAKFVDTCDDEDCFDRNTMIDILNYVKKHISDENKGFYHYCLNDYHYYFQLEDYIKYIIKVFNKNNSKNK